MGAPVDNSAGQLDAAAAGAELVELELEPSDEVELDFSDDEKPLPLNTTPTLPNSLRSRPLHSVHVVSAASLKACTASNRFPHSVHA